MKKVAVIDSGYSYDNHMDSIRKKIYVQKKEKGFAYLPDCTDEIGHGTAVCELVLDNLKRKIDLYIVKIFSEKNSPDVETLICALNYINENWSVDAIIISLGVRRYCVKLHEIIHKISDKGIIIVSAFDNLGCISYPAGFEEVIGVSVNRMYTDENLFSITNDDVVDIIGADCYFRLRWKENKKMILQGSSFCTAVIMNKLLASRKKFHTKQSAKEYLKSIAQSELIEQDCYDTNRIYNFVKNIHRAVIFPFNKEIHSLAAFENMLDFQVERYYDVREKMLVGKKISDILNYCDNSKCICDINSLCWEDEFDTIICGHLFEIQSLLKRNYIEKIIEKSKIYRKKVFFFDDISTYLIDKNKNEMICSVNAVKYYCPQVRDGMLAINGTPTVAVLGTSSKQGKYTIQLSLRNELMKRGYDVGVLGTEPSSFLFGFDETYAYGYGNMMNTLNDETTHIVNEMIRKINSQGRDIIITGAQSGMIPYYLTNTKMYTSKQLEFLLGVNPDTYILCVNSIDTIEYIKKTISFIESVTEAELAGIVISERLKSQGENFHIQDKLCECFGRNIIYYLEDMDIRRLGDSVIKRYKEW